MILAWLMVSTIGYAIALPYLQDNRTRQRNATTQNIAKTNKGNQAGNGNGKQAGDGKNGKQNGLAISAQPVLVDEDTIPDSLLHTRWQVQRTTPISWTDLYQSPLDLKRPDNMKYDVVYNDTIDRYIIGNRMGSTWLSAPIMMTPKEYMTWTEMQQRNDYFRKQNDQIFQAKGKEKFDFSDMHFDLGPAERICGPGGIRLKT